MGGLRLGAGKQILLVEVAGEVLVFGEHAPRSDIIDAN